MRFLGDYIIAAIFTGELKSRNSFSGDLFDLTDDCDLFWFTDENQPGQLTRKDNSVFFKIDDDKVMVAYNTINDTEGDKHENDEYEVRLYINGAGQVTKMEYVDINEPNAKIINVRLEV
jgi:hypothetical protein